MFVNVSVIHVLRFVNKMSREIKFEYTVGKRVDSRLVYTTDDEQLFVKCRDSMRGTHYNCYKKKASGCDVQIIVQNGVCSLENENNKHNHPNQRDEYNGFRKEQAMKLQCQNDPTISIKDVINQFSLSDETSSTETSPANKRKHRSTLYYNRHKKIPVNPTTIDDMVAYFNNETIQKLMSKSYHGKIVHHEVASNENYFFVIIAIEEILNDLPAIRKFVITASMRVVPPSCAFKVAVTFSAVKDDDVN